MPQITGAPTQLRDVHAHTFVGRDVVLNVEAHFQGRDLQNLLDRLLPLLRREDVRVHGGHIRAGADSLDVSSAQADALRKYVDAAPAADAEQRMERYLARLCVDPFFQQWHTRYVTLSGGYRAGPQLARRYSKILVRGEGPQRQIERVQLDDIRTVLDEHATCILLAQPGAGKSTVLQRLALDAAMGRLREPGARVPLFVSLAAQKRDETPLEFLVRSWCLELPGATADDFMRAWQAGRLCLLCDALNEARRTTYREQVADWRDLAARLPGGNRLLFSCRSQDYYGELGVQQVEIDPLSDAQIRDFARRYLQTEPDPQAEPVEADAGTSPADALWTALCDHPADLLPLARVPYYLHLLVEEFAQREELPADRAHLFENVVRALLEREAQKRHPDWIDPLAQHRALAQLAFAMQELGEGTRLDRDGAAAVLPDQIDLPERGPQPTPAAALLRLGRAATLITETPEGAIRFTHHLLQEYFAAEELLHRFARGEDLRALWRVPSRASDMPPAERGEWDPLPGPPTGGWEQTTVLAASLYPDLVDAVRPVNPALAARCLLESGTEADPVRVAASGADLLARLGDVQIHLRSRLEAGLLLGRLGDPRFPVETVGGVRVILPPMVPVDPAGATMGSDWWERGAEARERPRHPVTLAPYAMGRYPVTNAEYACFMAAGGYDEERYWTAGGRYWLRGESVPGEADPADWWMETWRRRRDNPQEIDEWVQQNLMTEHDAKNWSEYITWSEESFAGAVQQLYPSGQRFREPRFWQDADYNNPSQPVVGVCWYEAMAYARWLAELTGEPYRLPSEAQWEWAARRGRRRFAWGSAWDAARLNSLEGRVMRTAPVGVYPHGTTPDGIHDLCGNVWEWTSTRYADYPYAATDEREDPDGVGVRILRGGGWTANQHMVRCAFRDRNYPWSRRSHEGYRLARLLSR